MKTDEYCKDCDRSIYGKYHDCDINIENNGKYVRGDSKCYCKIVNGKRAERYPWEEAQERAMTKILKINGVKTARVRVVSDMNSDICFDITVPEDCVDKLKDLAPKCGYEWYNNPDYVSLGYAEPLCRELDKQGIPYILHDDVDEEPDDWAEFC